MPSQRHSNSQEDGLAFGAYKFINDVKHKKMGKTQADNRFLINAAKSVKSSDLDGLSPTFRMALATLLS